MEEEEYETRAQKFCLEPSKERDNLKDVFIDGRITLKLI
jgi:hypothetical protein